MAGGKYAIAIAPFLAALSSFMYVEESKRALKRIRKQKAYPWVAALSVSTFAAGAAMYYGGRKLATSGVNDLNGHSTQRKAPQSNTGL